MQTLKTFVIWHRSNLTARQTKRELGYTFFRLGRGVWLLDEGCLGTVAPSRQSTECRNYDDVPVTGERGQAELQQSTQLSWPIFKTTMRAETFTSKPRIHSRSRKWKLVEYTVSFPLTPKSSPAEQSMTVVAVPIEAKGQDWFDIALIFRQQANTRSVGHLLGQK